MSTLTKLQIRTIQTLNSATLSSLKDPSVSQKFDTIYIANSSTFYIANTKSIDTPITQAVSSGDKLKLNFNKEVVCEGSGEIVSQNDKTFEDMVLFFNIDASKIDHIIIFNIESIT